MPDTRLAGSQALTASLVGSQMPDASLVGSQTLTASLGNPDNIMSLTLEINGIEVHTWAASDLQAGEQVLTYMLSEREAQDILIHSQIELAYKLTAAQMEGEDLVKQETVSRTRPTPQFTANVFEPSGYFDQVCATPRVGLDRQGTTLHEKYWIRSFSHETYLWHDELTDIDPASIESKFTYFSRMRTRAFVRTGRAKDRHHGATNTERYRQRQNAAPKPSFGFDRSGSTLRNVYPGAPADTAGLKRGDVIVSATPAGWTSPVAGTAYAFTIRGRGSASTRQVSLTPQVLSKPPVQHVKVIDTDSSDTDSSEKVGYMAFFDFNRPAERELAEAIKTLKAGNVKDLVLDLRYNGGGLGHVAGELAYMIVGDQPGRTFMRLQHNGKLDEYMDRYVRDEDDEDSPLDLIPFISQAVGYALTENEALPTLDLERVFVLSTSATCSASEALINGILGVDGLEVILIGGKTCGKPHGFYGTDNCGSLYFTIQVAVVNDRDFGAYDDGFYPADAREPYGVSVPGCQVADDLTRDLGDKREAMLAAALHYRENGRCPPVTSAYVASVPTDQHDWLEQLEYLHQDEWQGMYFLEP